MRKRIANRDAALSALTIGVIILVVLALLSIPFLFLQYRAVEVQEERTVPSVTGVEHLKLNVTATVGHLAVKFGDLAGDAVRITAEVRGHAGFFGDTSPLRLDTLASNDTALGGKNLSVSIRFDTYAPWPYYSLSDLQYTVEVDRSLRSDLNLIVVTGGATLTTGPGVVLEGLRLNATNDGAVVSLNNGTVLAGNVNIRTATGGTILSWNNLTVIGDRVLSLGESSGKIDARFEQHLPLGSNVTIISKDTAGEMLMSFALSGDVSASVMANGGIGGVRLVPLGGFSGTANAFDSSNHPAAGSFDARLNNTIGGIIVEGRWTPG